jgi:hypothetical protein
MGKFVLIMVPLTVSGTRLHTHVVHTPADVTREVNRCLSVVRAAASRRGSTADPIERERRPRPGDRPFRR